MKVRSVRIENFKRFAPPGCRVDIVNTTLHKTADRFLLLGDNATGKTTVLQAIALTLALASGEIKAPAQLRWAGWMGERYLANGPPQVEVEVTFDEDELLATQEVARRWWRHFHGKGAGFVLPALQTRLTLALRGNHVEVVDGGEPALRQLQGRRYAAALAATGDAEARALFPRLPGVFWFDQLRNISLPGTPAPDTRESWDQTSFQLGVNRLRETLTSWYRVRQYKGPHPERDYVGELEGLYQRVFPGRSFGGLEPVYGAGPTPIDDRLVLTDGVRNYDLVEMSGGEQAVFPLLFEFVRKSIHRSVVLIDELDLNLHPPLAQRLLRLLPQLGTDNQFIFTTHSSAVADLVGEATTHRLAGGTPCL